MQLQKRRQEVEEQQQLDDSIKIEYEFRCKCGKTYCKQATVYNHIKQKHKNNKKEFYIKTNVKSGRPTREEAEKRAQNIKKKPKKTADKLQKYEELFKNPIYTNLIIKFKEYIKKEIAQDQAQEDNATWKAYIRQRDNLLHKIQFSKDRIDSLKDKTDFLFQKLSNILDKEYVIDIFLSFVRVFIQKEFILSDQDIYVLLEGADNNQPYYIYCLEVLDLLPEDEEEKIFLQQSTNNEQQQQQKEKDNNQQELLEQGQQKELDDDEEQKIVEEQNEQIQKQIQDQFNEVNNLDKDHLPAQEQQEQDDNDDFDPMKYINHQFNIVFNSNNPTNINQISSNELSPSKYNSSFNRQTLFFDSYKTNQEGNTFQNFINLEDQRNQQ